MDSFLPNYWFLSKFHHLLVEQLEKKEREEEKTSTSAPSWEQGKRKRARKRTHGNLAIWEYVPSFSYILFVIKSFWCVFFCSLSFSLLWLPSSFVCFPVSITFYFIQISGLFISGLFSARLINIKTFVLRFGTFCGCLVLAVVIASFWLLSFISLAHRRRFAIHISFDGFVKWCWC